jgi:hypothetical protein
LIAFLHREQRERERERKRCAAKELIKGFLMFSLLLPFLLSSHTKHGLLVTYNVYTFVWHMMREKYGKQKRKREQGASEKIIRCVIENITGLNLNK